MKYVRDYASKSHAKAFKNKLRKKGILAVTAPSKAAPDSPSYSPYSRMKFRTGVWVVIDYQYEDAINLKKGSSHVVKNPLTEEEMVRLELEAMPISSEKRNKRMNVIVSVLGIGLMSIFAYKIFLNV